MTETLARYDAWLTNPPNTDAPDEQCDGGNHDLGSVVYYLPVDDRQGNEIISQRGYMCAGCLREQLLRHYRDAPKTCLADPPEEAYPAEACDQCGYFRCRCRD